MMKKHEVTAAFEHYKRRYAYDNQHFSDGMAKPETRLVVVVPVYDEDLSGLMASLSACTGDLGSVTVFLVFNNPEGSSLAAKHQQQAGEWHARTLKNGLRVWAIEALSLPPKHAGVGMARKIGMDAALTAFAAIPHDGLIVCLDADCEVAPNYVEELQRAEKEDINGLSIYFEHPLVNLDKERQENIVRYEIWLRYYIQALRSIGYPHAFHTVGSSMAVRASVYARIGGMNRRKAGEDFYFLHKLIPQGKFYDLDSTTVYPSARDSLRVPFGTGRAMIDMQEDRKDFTLVYNPEIFSLIRPLLNPEDEVLQELLGGASGPLADAVNALEWQPEIAALISRSKTEKGLEKNFRYWFNGFRMLKLVHWLRDHSCQDIQLFDANYILLNINEKDPLTLLSTLRKLDQNSSFSYFWADEIQGT